MRAVIRLTILLLLVTLAGSIFIAEGSLNIWHKETPNPAAADSIAARDDASWSDVKVTAPDGSVLDAWLFTPRRPNRSAVIALHGVGDTRLGMLGHVDFLLRAGYTVLAPDCRGHGSSGGDLITFGVREANDVHLWADLLLRSPGSRLTGFPVDSPGRCARGAMPPCQGLDRLYGIGQSMGAAILLESLAREHRFRALVADCPFATFREIASERLAQQGPLGRIGSWPAVPLGFTWVRARYGVNLWQASPIDALRTTDTPVLLIHGAADTNIDPRHSRELHAINPAHTELWEVPGAGHVASLGAARQEYIRRVTAWLDK